MKQKPWKNGVYAAVFAALIFAATMIHLPVPLFSNNGYLHLGDAIILLCAACLSPVWACAAAGVGGALADIVVGAAAWAPATLIIKILLVLLVSPKGDRILTPRNRWTACLTVIPTVGGYYLAEFLLYGDAITPIPAILGNAIQAVGSLILFYVVGMAMDRAGLKKRLFS